MRHILPTRAFILHALSGGKAVSQQVGITQRVSARRSRACLAGGAPEGLEWTDSRARGPSQTEGPRGRTASE